MEKFAIDLDKVLDDFEFNEDCAEQIAAINAPPNNSTNSGAKCMLEPSGSNTYNYHKLESEKSIKDFQILPSLEKRKNSKDYDAETRSLKEQDIAADNIDYSKSDLMLGSAGSVNNFYIHDTITDNKVMPKQNALPYSSEQAPLTIHNDITQKVLQKQQNGSTNPKIDNRYDKKLNQLNIKPSVSNVLNSLNEYINAPSGGFNYVHAVLDKTEDEPNLDSITFQNINKNSTKDNFVKDYTVIKNITKDTNESITQGQTSSTFNPVQESCASHSESIVVPTTLSAVTAHISSTEDDNTTSTTENEKQLLKHEASAAINENAIQYEYKDVFVDVIMLNSEAASSFSDTAVDNKETINDKQEKISQSPVNECVYPEDQQKQITTENEAEVTAKELVSEKTRIADEVKPEVEGANVDTMYTDNSIPVRKVFGFSNIDDLSEEELTRYLTELEEEERLKDTGMPQDTFASKSQEEVSEVVLQAVTQTETDETIHNLPIVECVVTAEIPSVSESSIQTEPKLLSVNHYSEEKQDGKTANATIVVVQNAKEYRNSSESNIKGEQCHMTEEVHTSSNNLTDTLSSTRNMEFESSSAINNESNKMSDDCANSQEKVVSTFTSTPDLQEHYTYKLNVEHESLNCNKADRHLKETEGAAANPPPYEEACEMKMESSFDQISADNDTMSYENRILEHATNYTDDATKNIETSLEINPNDSSDESDKPVRPQTLDIGETDSADQPGVTAGSTNVAPPGAMQSDIDAKDDCQGSSPDVADNILLESNSVLGKQPPFWVPDSDAPSCMLCDIKFTVLKRRHHCRACGKVLCSKCCNMKYKLEYQGNIDSRVCVHCYQLLTKAESEPGICDWNSGYSTYTSNNDINSPQGRQPNPNNPMEYCSTIPPLQQLAGGLPPPPTVMVPVGVLKREGGNKNRPEGSKSVMFSDGIRPGCDLTELDMSWDLKPPYRKPGSKRISTSGSSFPSTAAKRQNLPRFDPNTNSYVPHDPNALPPTVTIYKGQVTYHAVTDGSLLYKTLKNECEPPVMFAINRNLYAYVKITNLNCCVNKICWNVTSKGLACVGQDEVILLVETLPDETRIPKDLLIFINQLYIEAIKGNTVSELGFAVYQSGNLLGSREHAGFLFIRQTLQCLQKIVLPAAPFLVGLLVHRWETPWAKVFPLRLLLRLGAEYRYYPCPMVSVRFRDALYFEIGHTVMKVLADFRNFGYTLPGVRGLTIHLRNRMTDVMFPRNRYDQVIKGLNNSNDHVLAYASNFSISADSHLVCIQTNTGDESSYQTQAINIHNKPRTVTGASFIVINGALKSSMGLSAKSSIVEDGLMVEIMPEKMEALKAALKNMQDFSIGCGRQGAAEPDETVNIKWVDNDVQFNLGVKSPIDGQLMDGIPSIRVHNGTDYKGTSRFIRWTEVFIMKSDDHPNGVHDPVDINKLSGNIAKATCTALVKLLDLLSTAGLTKLGVRTTIHPDNVGYEAGSEGTKLPPIYMNSLDNELIQVLHKAAQNSQDTHTVLELIFYILDD